VAGVGVERFLSLYFPLPWFVRRGLLLLNAKTRLELRSKKKNLSQIEVVLDMKEPSIHDSCMYDWSSRTVPDAHDLLTVHMSP
jgi:hypothetical protein